MQIQNPVLQGMEQGKRAHESLSNLQNQNRLANKQAYTQLQVAASQAKDPSARAELLHQADVIGQSFMRKDQFGRNKMITNDWQTDPYTQEADRQKQAADTNLLNQNYQYQTYWDPVSGKYKRALQSKEMQNQIAWGNRGQQGENYDPNIPYRNRVPGEIVGPQQYPQSTEQQDPSIGFWERMTNKNR